MELTATVTKVLPLDSGVSRSGNPYKRQTVIAQYGDQYPKEVALTLMNDKCDPTIVAGMQLKFHFDVSSREYNGKYYTECIVWKVEAPYVQQTNYSAPQYQQQAAPSYVPPTPPRPGNITPPSFP